MDLSPDGVETGPSWLEETRREAGRRFGELGLPTLRDEEWRQTSVKAIRETDFRRPGKATTVVSADDLARFAFRGLEASRLVFVNGRYDAGLSSIAAQDRVVVMPLAEACAAHADLVQPHLTRHAAWSDDAFSALNTASFDDGTFVHVPDGVSVEMPIHVVNVSTAPDHAVATHPRALIVAGDGAAVTVIEDYVALADDVYLNNAVTEIVVGANADVHHYFVERESLQAFNVSTLHVQQKDDSRFASHSVLLGGAIVRNNVVPVLDGERCDSLLNGLYVGNGSQHHDNHMRVVHAKPNCESRQYYKGILNDEARGVFTGRIVVIEDAQKTDAIQSNASLLLSDSARANAQPQLEIYADDVRCTHGATIGELDEQAIFYLTARGVGKATARGILVHAFAAESLERMELTPVRTTLERLLLDRLPESETLAKVFG